MLEGWPTNVRNSCHWAMQVLHSAHAMLCHAVRGGSPLCCKLVVAAKLEVHQPLHARKHTPMCDVGKTGRPIHSASEQILPVLSSERRALEVWANLPQIRTQANERVCWLAKLPDFRGSDDDVSLCYQRFVITS
jgi:hypothetical protein